MKKLLLKSSLWRGLLSLLFLLAMVGNAWGDVATLSFTAACNGSGTDDKNNSWTVTSDAEESTFDSTKGIHYGTGRKAVSYITLATSGISGVVTKVVVNASGASGTSAKLDVKVGGSAFGSQASLTSSNAEYTFEGSATGAIEVKASQTSATKALYVKSIAVTYSTDGKVSYTVTYNANSATSGSVPTDGTKYDKDASVTVLGNTGSLARTGYTYADWNTKADGTGTDYAAGATFTITANTTLYAKWTANNYNVTFDKNAEDATGSMEPQQITFDLSANLTANAFERAHYTFSGWATTASGTKTYNDKASYKMTSEGATLYAVWTANKTTVTLNKDGGTGGNSSVTASYGQAMPSAGNVPTRTGYTFTGYYTEQNGQGTKYYNADNSSAQNWDKDDETATLYAGWEAKTITLTLNKGAHGQADGTATIKYGTSTLLTSTFVEPTTGYTLDGYYTTSTGGSKVLNADGTLGSQLSNWIDANGKCIKTADATLYAHYTAINYNVTWISNGQSWADKGGSTTAAYDAKIAAVPTTTPTVEFSDKVFVGWTTADSYSNENTAPLVLFTKAADAPTITGDVTYYAVFADLDGATATFDASTATASNDLTWTSNGITLKLSAGSLYQTGTPNTFTVTGGTSNYFRITSETYDITKIVTEVTTTSYKINSVTAGTLSTNGTTQTVASFTAGTKSVDCKASSSQIRATNIYVEAGTFSNYATSVAVKTLTGISFGGSLTKTVYTEEETFDPAGITVLASFQGQAEKEDVTSKTTINYSTDPLTVGTTQVQVSASWKGQNCQDNYSITVNAIPTYTITASAATGGSYTVKIGDEEAANVPAEGTTYQSRAEKVVTLTSAASEGYKIHSTPFVVEDAGGTKVDVSKSGDNYTFKMPAKAVTITAQFVQQFTIATTTPENGTITSIKDSDGNDITATSKGSKVWVTVTPETHYHLNAITVKKADESEVTVTVDPENKNRASYTMPQSNVTVSATFIKDNQYPVSFWANNVQFGDVADYYEGEDITFPAENPADVNGMKFVGWTEAEIENPTDTKPTFVTFAKMGTQNKVFYAVFANVTPGEDTNATSTLTLNAGVLSDTYTDSENNIVWTLNNVTTVASGESAGFRSSNSYVSCTLPANATATKYVVTKTNNAWANEASIQLVDASDNVIKTSSAEFSYDFTSTNNAAGTYKLKNNSTKNAWIKSIAISYTIPGASYSNYCTTVAAHEPTSYELTIGSTGYATYYNSAKAYVLPDDCEGYVFTATSGLSKAYDAESVVPAGEPIVIYTIEPGTKTLNFTTSSEDTYKSLGDEYNALYGTDVATEITADDNSYFYGLSMGKTGSEYEGKVGFYWMNATGAAFTNGAHKAYLKLAKSSGVKAQYVFGEDETAISQIENGNLKIENGKYMENGKIVIMKNGKKYNAAGLQIR